MSGDGDDGLSPSDPRDDGLSPSELSGEESRDVRGASNCRVGC